MGDVIEMGGNTAVDLKARAREIAGLVRVEKQIKVRGAEVRGQIKELMKRADSAGHDPGILKTVVAEALLTAEERSERYANQERNDTILEQTRRVLGLLDEDDDPLGVTAEADEKAKPHADLLGGE